MPRITYTSIFVVSVLLSFMVACHPKKVIDFDSPISKGLWHKDSIVRFSFLISDTISKRNLFIHIRNNNRYPFSNLFLIATLRFPSGQKITDTLEYRMTDATGRFLGSGIFNTKENKLFYKENKNFPKAGRYIFEVAQAMRKGGEVNGVTSLEGLINVGFSIEKTVK